MGDVGLAIQRAEDKTQSMQARAGAIDELVASGALSDPTGSPSDDIQLELDRMSSTSDVEAQLAALKGEIAAAPAPAAIEGAAAPRRRSSRSPGSARRGQAGGVGMILRILGEGQFEVADHTVEALNGLDNELQSAIEAGDEAAFHTALAGLLALVREVGEPVAADHLGPSDLVLPAAESTLEEVRALLGDEGLIPG